MYIWSRKKPKCNVYEIKRVTGIITTIDLQRYFAANESLVHLDIREHLKKCEKDDFITDFEGIYILDMSKVEPIENSLSAVNLSIMKDYSIRDRWIFNKLTIMIRENVSKMS